LHNLSGLLTQTAAQGDDVEQPLVREIIIGAWFLELSDQSDALADLLFNENANMWILDETSFVQLFNFLFGLTGFRQTSRLIPAPCRLREIHRLIGKAALLQGKDRAGA
jgi:hypothetical protein